MPLNPSTWFSLSPLGLGQTKPHHFREIARVAWENRAEIPDVLISEADARALGVSDGDRVRLVSGCGQFSGRAKLAPIKPGNLEVHWPEGMELLSEAAVDPESGEPDDNSRVRVERSG